MTPDEFAKKLRAKLEDFKRNNTPFQLTVYDTVGNVSRRAFQEGKDNNGNQYQYKDSWYKQYREDRGRETSFVNWRFEGDLKSDYENAPKGSQPSAVRINAQHYQSMVRDINEKKYKGLSEGFTGKKGGRFAGFGKFLELSKDEEANFYRLLELNTRNFFANL